MNQDLATKKHRGLLEFMRRPGLEIIYDRESIVQFAKVIFVKTKPVYIPDEIFNAVYECPVVDEHLIINRPPALSVWFEPTPTTHHVTAVIISPVTFIQENASGVQIWLVQNIRNNNVNTDAPVLALSWKTGDNINNGQIHRLLHKEGDKEIDHQYLSNFAIQVVYGYFAFDELKKVIGSVAR